MNYAGHHVISSSTPTMTTSPLAIGFIWSDTSDNSLKQCSSVSPVTFVSVGGGGGVTDANVSFSDITTGNASSTKHGFMPKLPWTLDGGTITADTPFKLVENWNNAAISFNGFVVDCTASSMLNGFLTSWRKGGVEQAFVRHDGYAFFNNLESGGTVTGARAEFTNNGYVGISDGTDYTHLRRVASAGFKVTNSGGSTYRSFESLYERWGSGTPEGAVTAPIGAVFHRTDGGAGTSFYVKESGAGNTGWVGK